jgi:hypothetical protein
MQTHKHKHTHTHMQTHKHKQMHTQTHMQTHEHKHTHRHMIPSLNLAAYRSMLSCTTPGHTCCEAMITRNKIK